MKSESPSREGTHSFPSFQPQCGGHSRSALLPGCYVVLFAVTVENIWLDPWLRSRFPAFPSLAPQPPSAFWIITFAAIGIVCVVLMVGQVLLMAAPQRNTKDCRRPFRRRAAALVTWFLVTSGIAVVPH